MHYPKTNNTLSLYYNEMLNLNTDQKVTIKTRHDI